MKIRVKDFLTILIISNLMSINIALAGKPAPPPISPMTSHEADCAIWLCLPAGFPSGCEAPHSKFLKRIRKGKSPLPGFGSCSDSGNDEGFSYDYQRLMYIPPKTCTTIEAAIGCVATSGGWVSTSSHSGGIDRRCPSICRHRSYITIYEHGVPIGGNYVYKDKVGAPPPPPPAP